MASKIIRLENMVEELLKLYTPANLEETKTNEIKRGSPTETVKSNDKERTDGNTSVVSNQSKQVKEEAEVTEIKKPKLKIQSNDFIQMLNKEKKTK